MEIACLDLGSNSFHLQHLRVSDSALELVLDDKHSVRLGDGVSRTGGIDARGWRDGYAAVEALLERSRARRPDRQVAVATSAVRSANNGRKFLEELRRCFDLDVMLLTPEREAALGYLGATNDPVVGGRRVAVIDVGGGSTELSLGQGARCLHADSLPLGTLRLHAALGDRTLDRRRAAHLAQAVRARHEPALRGLAALQPEQVVLASGVARAVRKLAHADSDAPGPTGALEVTQLRLSLERHLDCSPAELVERGVEPARADTVMLAHVIVLALCEGLGVHSAHVTAEGLRSGLALEQFRLGRTRARGLELSGAASAGYVP